MAQSLGKDVPFTVLAGSEIYSMEMSKTEALTQALRRSIGVRISEAVERIHGEVVEIVIDRPAVASLTGKSGKLTIKTTDMETVYDLGPKLIEALTREKVVSGDVISIDKTNGRISKLGRSYSRARDFDAVSSAINWTSCPSGELLKRETVSHVVTLHEIDVINSKGSGTGLTGLFAGNTGEIQSEIRTQVDSRILEWKEDGKAEILPGILFIDEVFMLDMEAFTFLNRVALENPLSPILILASNRESASFPIRGSLGESGPHGVPSDFLDRLLVVYTSPYSSEDVNQILKIRANEENVVISDEALAELSKIAFSASLRYSCQLISVAHLIALRQSKASPIVSPSHIARAASLFLDKEKSVKFCQSTFL